VCFAFYFIIQRPVAKYAIVNGIKSLNVASYNFLNMVGNPIINVSGIFLNFMSTFFFNLFCFNFYCFFFICYFIGKRHKVYTKVRCRLMRSSWLLRHYRFNSYSVINLYKMAFSLLNFSHINFRCSLGTRTKIS
jgi:hypothetical protein